MPSLEQPKFIQITGKSLDCTRALDENGKVWYYQPYGENRGWHPLVETRYASTE